MKRVLFLYLKAFSFTGGIEKFNRAFLKALSDLMHEQSFIASSLSVYDLLVDERYFSATRFKGFTGNRLRFFVEAIFYSFKFDVIILGHINLAIVGYCIKKIRPAVKIILIAHGIEVWEKQTGIKFKILQEANWIFSVSNFTKAKILEYNSTIKPDKIQIFPNVIDPFFALPATFEKPSYLLERYRLSPDDKILLTITRLQTTEKYKGYDHVIKAIAKLRGANKNLKYLLCGKADAAEKKRVIKLIEDEGLQSNILLTGYINDNEIVDHYLMADVFVMPSKKEGFGIVFIEALACGRKVIAGSKDGSVEALQNGELGQLIDPDSVDELTVAINKSLKLPNNPHHLQQEVLSVFNFPDYKLRLRNYLLKA